MLIALSLCSNIIGCFETLYHPKTEVIDGKFITPKGQFKVITLGDLDRDKSPFSHSWRMKEGGVTYIYMAMTGQYT